MTLPCLDKIKYMLRYKVDRWIGEKVTSAYEPRGICTPPAWYVSSLQGYTQRNLPVPFYTRGGGGGWVGWGEAVLSEESILAKNMKQCSNRGSIADRSIWSPDLCPDLNRRTEGQLKVWIDGRMDGCMDRRTDG